MTGPEQLSAAARENAEHAIEDGVDPDFAYTIASIQGPVSLREADLLRDLAARVKRGVIVEIGAFRGRSTVALSYGARQGNGVPVFAIDPHEPFEGPFGGRFGPADRRAFYENMLATGAWENVRLINLPSVVAAAGWQHRVGLLWIDGDHAYESVRADFEAWRPHLIGGARVAVDDTDRGGPKQLVEELVGSGRWEYGRRVRKVRVLRRVPRGRQ